MALYLASGPLGLMTLGDNYMLTSVPQIRSIKMKMSILVVCALAATSTSAYAYTMVSKTYDKVFHSATYNIVCNNGTSKHIGDGFYINGGDGKRYKTLDEAAKSACGE